MLRDQPDFRFKARPSPASASCAQTRILQAPSTRPMPHAEPELMIITKDNQKSRVHRPAYLDLHRPHFDAEHCHR